MSYEQSIDISISPLYVIFWVSRLQGICLALIWNLEDPALIPSVLHAAIAFHIWKKTLKQQNLHETK